MPRKTNKDLRTELSKSRKKPSLMNTFFNSPSYYIKSSLSSIKDISTSILNNENITKDILLNNLNNILKKSKLGFSKLIKDGISNNSTNTKKAEHHFNKIKAIVYETQDYLYNKNTIDNKVIRNIKIIRIIAGELLQKYLKKKGTRL